MRALNICVGKNRFAKTWKNKEFFWEKLTKRFCTTTRTPETTTEYSNMEKKERDDIKDKGGFVGGFLKNNSRKIENVDYRSMLTLDADHAEPDFLPRILEVFPYTCCIYTTHGHTPDKPRFRMIVPLARDVSPEEYVALARLIANDLGIDQFDEVSFRPNQLMYWPTTSSDGEFISQTPPGDWLDPDAVFAAHPNWADCSQLPISSREQAAQKIIGTNQQDPLAKSNIVGAFCAAYYPIHSVINAYLADVYTPSAVKGRYDYISAKSNAGLVFYDNKFAYSHHASDPAYGKLLNAFDLVRIHKFRHLGEQQSFIEMRKLALADERVGQLLNDPRFADAEKQKNEDWKLDLVFQSRGDKLENSVHNLSLILANDPDLTGIALNELAHRIQIIGKLPWSRPNGNLYWTDADSAQLKALLDSRYRTFSTRNHDIAFIKATNDRSFHPIRNYLDSLPPWDGVSRVESLLINYLQADDTPFVRAVTRKTVAAMVARTYHPGTKFDYLLVLDGAQGIGKSTIFKDLISTEYYSESLSLTDMNDKCGAEKLQGIWVAEIAELAGMKRADIEKVKSFLSTTDDQYRPSYGKTVESHPRHCVIIATVNGDHGYLRDITGNRRFWIVKLHQKEQKKMWHFDQNFRDQFWAEAKQIYESGEKLYLEGALLGASEKIQRDAMEQDDRLGIVAKYLDTPLPEDWDQMDLFARRQYIAEADSCFAGKGTVMRDEVSNVEIWCECFGKDFSECTNAKAKEISGLMQQMAGWQRDDGRVRQAIYGQQRVYRRKSS